MKGLELLRIKLSERVLSYGRAGRSRTVPDNGRFLVTVEQSTFVTESGTTPVSNKPVFVK